VACSVVCGCLAQMTYAIVDSCLGSGDLAFKWNCLGASLGRSLASLKKPMPAKKMRMLWQKAILETMMLIQMNRETQPCRLRHCLLMSLFFSVLSNIHICSLTCLALHFVEAEHYML